MAKITKAIFDVTSPTVQYGNVHTIIEVEGENWEDIRDLGLGKIAEADAMVSPTPFTLKKAPKQVKAAVVRTEQLTSRLTGVSLEYDPEAHAYVDANGKVYQSGSVFPDQFYEPFDKVKAVELVLKAYPDSGITREQLLDIWSRNGDISTEFGNAVHAAVENYAKHYKVGDAISGVDTKGNKKPNKALSKNPFFSKIVKDYEQKFGFENILAEEFIADATGHCGRVDAIKIVDKEKKIIRIVDFKTDSNLFEKKYQKKDSPFKNVIKENTMLTYHRFQMSFYAYILAQYGYTVEGIDLDWLNPNTLEWERHSTEVIDLSKILGDK